MRRLRDLISWPIAIAIALVWLKRRIVRAWKSRRVSTSGGDGSPVRVLAASAGERHKDHGRADRIVSEVKP